ncbi:DUF4781 domain-containing protein [Pararoseomonas sp. SCSIO 73927]|uniref:DUF4781 domain-containing protein n=1 Tax=Pararoseomonas sp. SCSIO 73927 TaxID=3114537 RepID=UPI0030D4CB89
MPFSPQADTLTRTGAEPPSSRPAEADGAAFEASVAQQRSAAEGGATPAAAPAAEPPAPPPETTPEAPPAPPPEPAVSEERTRQIESWVEHDSEPHNDGFLWLDHHGTDEKVADALGGGSSLGELTEAEGELLLDRMSERWAAGQGEGTHGATELMGRLEDPGQRAHLAGRLATRAGELADAPVDGLSDQEKLQRRVTIQSLAETAITGTGGPLEGPVQDPQALGEMIRSLGPDGAASLARALAPERADLATPMLETGGPDFATLDRQAELLTRSVAALNAGPRTEETGAFVQNAFAVATEGSYTISSVPRDGAMEPRGEEGVPDLRQEMATALSREWNPENPGADRDRLAGILDTHQGRALLGADETVPLEARVNALAVIRADPGITGETLGATNDPWTNPAITVPIAQASAAPYLQRGDGAQRLTGTDIENTVGTAMGFPPSLDGLSPEEAQNALASGQNVFAEGPNAEAVSKVAEGIRTAAGGDTAEVAVVPVTYSSGETGPITLPLFRVTGAGGEERFVDNAGAVYRDFDHWRETNDLPSGQMLYPENGHLTAGADGRPALGQGNTPKTVDSFGEAALSVLDTAALVGGVVAAGAFIVGTGGTGALVIGGAAAAYGAGRAGAELWDRADHQQSLSLADPEARGLWLNLGANVAGVGAFGSAARLAQIARSGAAIAPVEASILGWTQATAGITDAAAIANQGVEMFQNWNQMSGEQRAQGLLQMAFWGATTGASLRSSGAHPGDMFNPVAIRDSLLDTYRPPVVADASLPGNTVRIVADGQTGAVREIRHGPQATPEDIALHERAAIAAQRTGTLEARLGALLGGEAAPPPGSQGWAARQDIAKIRERTDANIALLARDDLTPAQRAQVESDIAADGAYIDQLTARVNSFARNPGEVYIDGPSSGLSLAREMGAENLLNGLNARSTYYTFRVGEDGALMASARNHPWLTEYRVEPGADGPQLTVSRQGVGLVDGTPPINSRYAGETMPRSALTPDSQANYTDALEMLPAPIRAGFVDGVPFSAEGYPQMPSVFRAELPESGYVASREQHFREANRQLRTPEGQQALRDSGLRQDQIDEILADAAAHPDQSPAEWTWHHTENPGELVLVPRGIHNAVKHTGGKKIWGGGGAE